MNYKKILVPHDGSDMADVALHHAMRFAKAYNAEIILLSIVKSINLPSLAFMSTSERRRVKQAFEESIVALKKEGNRMLEKKSSELSNEGIKVAKMLIVASDPAGEIINVAKTRDVDIVIIGSRGLKGLAKLQVLGSVARRVSEHVHCPVLIMR